MNGILKIDQMRKYKNIIRFNGKVYDLILIPNDRYCFNTSTPEKFKDVAYEVPDYYKRPPMEIFRMEAKSLQIKDKFYALRLKETNGKL